MNSPHQKKGQPTTTNAIPPIRLPPWEITELLRQDACSFAYTHVISGTALEQWRETFLPTLEQGVLPGRWFMKHGVYTLVAPKELSDATVDLKNATRFAYRDAGELSRSAIAVFALKPGARWYDACALEARKQRSDWGRSAEKWDEFAFAHTEGRRNLYNFAHEAHFYTTGGFVGELKFYPVLRNVKQIARAVIFVPDEDINSKKTRKIVIEAT